MNCKRFLLGLSLFFYACSDYQARYEDAFGAMNFTAEEGDSSDSDDDLPGSSSSKKIPDEIDEKSSSSSVIVSSADATSSSSLASSSSLNSSSSSKEHSSSSFDVAVIKFGESEQEIRITTIDAQTWMAENISIDGVTSYCENFNCTNGRFYSWDNANQVCPEGWHLPDTTEWKTLIAYVGDGSAQKLKSRSWNGSDDYNFSVKAAGSGSLTKNYAFKYNAEETCFWSGNETSSEGESEATALCFYSNEDEVVLLEKPKAALYSVRCLMGPKKEVATSSSSYTSSSSSLVTVTTSTDSIAFNPYKTVSIGGRTWMAENANKLSGPPITLYECYESDCEVFGKFYQWNEARMLTGGNLDGTRDWLLLDTADIRILLSNVNNDVNGLLSEDWAGGTNAYQFNILQSGYFDESKVYHEVDEDGYKACLWLWDGAGQNGTLAYAVCFKDNGVADVVKRSTKNYYPIRLVREK